MKAIDAYNHIDTQKWATTSIPERLHLLEDIRANIKDHFNELGASDRKMKNDLIGEEMFSMSEAILNTVVPVANTVTACIHLYESLLKEEMLSPIAVNKIDEDLYDIHVFPQEAKDKIMYRTQKGYIRVKGEPKQVNPLEKETGIIAVLGAGNYSSSLEMVKALFLENCCVVHKPHELNEETDAVWEKIFKPVVDLGALSFCSADQGQELTTLEGISKIYFTGSTRTAELIKGTAKVPLVSECGGNNPCIIVPGIEPWTEKEIRHQAVQIATMSKINGGAVCGRSQTIITSKNWNQREEFIAALKKAISEDTPATGTYYPGSDKIKEEFLNNYPDAEVLEPENGKHNKSAFVFINDLKGNDFALKHEAFCQIMSEIPLDLPVDVEEFLPKAVEFCNNELLGTLAATILIDDKTPAKYENTLKQAVTDLEYGAITVNTMPPIVFLNPYLTWGGNEEGKTFVSGTGNFGNLLCYENVEKSILYDEFMSLAHMMRTNMKQFENLSTHIAEFAVDPSWMNLSKMAAGAVVDSFRGKDF